jgi:rhodanese-related sulfurtransferase
MAHDPAFVALCEAARAEIQELTLAEYLDLNEPCVLVDVREDREWARGSMPGAVHIGRGVLERDAHKVLTDRSALVVLFCGGGYRSALAARNLGAMGYTRVASLAGGIKGWWSSGLEGSAPPR